MFVLRKLIGAASFKIAFIYFSISFFWILLSDKVVLILSRDANFISQVQTYKGWFFIIATSVLIYLLTKTALENKNLLISKLNSSEQRFKLLSEMSNDGLVFHKNGIIIDINLTLCKIYQESGDYFLGKDMYEVLFYKSFSGQIRDNMAHAPLNPFETLALKSTHNIMNIEVIPQYAPEDNDFQVLSIRDITERKKTEQALKDSKRKFEAIFNQTFSFIGLLTSEGIILEINSSALAFIDKKAEDVIGQFSWETPWWNKKPQHVSLIKDAVKRAAKGEFVRFETEHTNARGELENIDFSLKPVFDEKGIVSLLIPEGRIITQQKKTERELWKAQSLLSEAINQSPSGIIIADAPSGEIRIANPSAKELFGDLESLFPPKNCDGSTPKWSVINSSETNKDASILPLSLVMQNGIMIKNKEIILSDGFGTQHWLLVNAAPIYNENGTISGGMLIFNDITRIKQMEHELRESEEKYRQLMEFLPDAVVLAQDDKIVFCNQMMADLVGAISKDKLKGEKYIDYIVPGKRNEIIERSNKIIQGDAIKPYLETALIRSDKTIVPVDIIATALLFNHKPAIMACIRDISERKNTEQQILNAIIKTEERERSHFAEEIHDGLGPIFSTIKLYTQSAIEEQDPNEKTALLNRIQVTINEAITSLREISNNISPHVLRNFGLASALKIFIDKISPLRQIGFVLNNNIEARLNENIETIIYRVLIELINNTIKHAQASEVRIDLTQQDNLVTVNYQDDGKGSNLNDVFEQKKGLGLFNIQNRIHSVNGHIEFFSTEGSGFQARISILLNTAKKNE